MAGAESDSTSVRQAHWEAFFARKPDPWGYGNAYEVTKYEQTMALLPPGQLGLVLELACAEGHFTQRLAERADAVIATDISPIAVERAQARCAGAANVRFQALDFIDEDLPGAQDLIICSEALYYATPAQLALLPAKFAAALKPGGHLLMAHASMVADDRAHTGFDWGHDFGVRTIASCFAGCPDLMLARELRTPLYRIQLFRRATPGEVAGEPEIIETMHAAKLPPAVAATVIWDGAVCTRAEAQAREQAASVPILMYHSIADDGAAELSPYRVTPAAFAAQLRYLRRHGYHSITLAQWAVHLAQLRPVPGRPVIITLDDGYRNVLENAVPLLEASGFSATLFVVTGKVGGVADWDSTSAAPLPLMDWDELRDLHRRGFELGSHTTGHARLPSLSDAQIIEDGLAAHASLREQLGIAVTCMAFPWGMENTRVRAALVQAGYMLAVGVSGGRSTFGGDPMLLPRIEIFGDDELDMFARRLEVGLEVAANPKSEWHGAVPGSAFVGKRSLTGIMNELNDSALTPAHTSISPDAMQDLALVFVTIERPALAQRLVRSVRALFPDMPIYAADQSRNIAPMRVFYAAHGVQLLEMTFDCGVAVARNQLVAAVREELFVLCDDDFILRPYTSFAEALALLGAEPGIGVVGGALYDTSNAQAYLRRWEMYLHYDRENRLLTGIPLHQMLPPARGAGASTYYMCDTVLNFALFRRALFAEGIGWDEQFKSNGEHEDFYLNLMLNSPYKVAYMPAMLAEHHHPPSYARYHAGLRDREEGWRLFMRKWAVDRYLECGYGTRCADDPGRVLTARVLTGALEDVAGLPSPPEQVPLAMEEDGWRRLQLFFRYDPLLKPDSDFTLWYRAKNWPAAGATLEVRLRWFDPAGGVLVWESEALELRAGGEYWQPVPLALPLLPTGTPWVRFEVYGPAGLHAVPLATGFAVPGGAAAPGYDVPALSLIHDAGAALVGALTPPESPFFD